MLQSQISAPAPRMERRGACLHRSIAAAATAGTAPATTIAAPTRTAPATTVTAPATAIFSGLSLIDSQSPAFDLLAVERLDGRLGFRVAVHFDESEPFRPAGVTIHDHLCRLHAAMRRE